MQEHAKTWSDSGMCALCVLVLGWDDSAEEIQQDNTIRLILTNLARPELKYQTPSC